MGLVWQAGEKAHREHIFPHLQRLLLSSFRPPFRSEGIHILPKDFLITMNYPSIDADERASRYIISVDDSTCCWNDTFEEDSCVCMDAECFMEDRVSETTKLEICYEPGKLRIQVSCAAGPRKRERCAFGEKGPSYLQIWQLRDARIRDCLGNWRPFINGGYFRTKFCKNLR